jgi:hypothetical protein
MKSMQLRFYHDVLAGKSGVPALPDGPMAVAWLDRRYSRLAGIAYADKVSGGGRRVLERRGRVGTVSRL